MKSNKEMKEHLKEYCADEFNLAALNFALGKYTLIEAINMQNVQFTKKYMHAKDYRDFIIDEFEEAEDKADFGDDQNIQVPDRIAPVTDHYDPECLLAISDFCVSGIEFLSKISDIFTGYRLGIEEVVKTQNPDATEEQIEVFIKDIVLKTLRVDFFSFLSDTEFEKIYDNETLGKKIRDFCIICNECLRKPHKKNNEQ